MIRLKCCRLHRNGGSCRPWDEAREDPVQDCLAAAVGAGLDPRVADVCEAHKVELLGKVIAGYVVGLDNGERKRDIGEPSGRHIRHRPSRADRGVRHWEERDERGEERERAEELHPVGDQY